MSGKKLTGWLKGSEKPVRVGVYERKEFRGSAGKYSYWNGTCWVVGDDSIDHAPNYYSPSLNQNVPWRGLARRPR